MLKPFMRLLVLLLIVLSQSAHAASGCSIYSNYGGNNGKTWFNEYYFGPAASNFLEIFSKNSTVNQSNQAIWNNWHLRVYSRAGNSIATETYRLNTNTTACTVSGGRTYLTYSDPALSLNYNDAMVVVFDGPPDLSSTKEIDALVYSNGAPPAPYNNSIKFYTPTCPALKSALDSQLAATAGRSSYNGQNMLILGSFGTKDIARLPDGTGAWDETNLTGSGTTYTQCVTNDPVDLVKSFTWAPTYTTATSSGTVDPGAVVTFTIAATNKTSSSMVGVKVSDTLPTGLSYAGGLAVSAGATAACSGTPTTCVMTASSALSPNAKITMSFQATVSSASSDAGATFQNTAIQSGGTTLVPAPSADAYITVASGLALALGVDKSTPAVGERLTFTVTATNGTSYPMAGTVVTVPFPTGLTYYSGYVPQVTGGTVSCTASACTWTLPATLAAGAGATLTFQATASGAAGQSITTTATQTSGSTMLTGPAASATITMAGASAAGFNACHNFSNTNNCSRTSGRLYTRLVGTSFTTEIVALKADGSLATDYVGSSGAAKTVKVDLLNADNANSQIATQNVTFAGGNTTGRVTATWSALTTAYKNIQIRITETTGTQPISDLSSDTFAVRPSAIVVTTSANAATAVKDSTPVVKAGRPFTITASTSPSAGYAGTVTLDSTMLSTGNIQVGNLRDAGGSNVFSVQVNAPPADNASYDEVGYFYASEGAFRDESFTLVDQPNDCLTSAAGNAYVADTLDNATGKYGCYIGNTSSVSFARFIPDHFAVVSTPAFTPGHALCGFSYMDQPFTLTAEIEARNAAGTRTRNYHGTFANGVVQVQMENADDGVSIPDTRLNRPGTQAWSEGTFAFSANRFNRPTSPAGPDGPFDRLAIGLSVTDQTALPALLRGRDMDSATTNCVADTAGASNGTCTAVNLINNPAKQTVMRFGRLRLSNAHGSELLPLTIPVRTEFFRTGTGFVRNDLDSCTTLATNNIQLKNHVPTGFAASMSAANIQIGAFTDGTGRLSLSAPVPRPAGRSNVMLCVDLGTDTPSTTAGVTAPACTATSANMPWLQGKWSETLFDDDPTSLATFGVYKAGPVIHVREVFNN